MRDDEDIGLDVAAGGGEFSKDAGFGVAGEQRQAVAVLGQAQDEGAVIGVAVVVWAGVEDFEAKAMVDVEVEGVAGGQGLLGDGVFGQSGGNGGGQFAFGGAAVVVPGVDGEAGEQGDEAFDVVAVGVGWRRPCGYGAGGRG